VVAANVALKTGLIKHHRMRLKQRFVATAAVRRVAQVGTANPVGGVAVGANKVQ
jgi:hypothetical protein